jgi:lysophospholipid acyltransferase (LPLAT)-like uncharacterized protein
LPVPPELPASPATVTKKRSHGVVVPHKATFKQRLAAWAVYLALRGIALTLRRRLEDRSGFFSPQPAGPAIYVVWHNRLALCLEAYWRYAGRYRITPGLAAMVSASKDGGFLSGILERYGVQPVRGSSSRRGAQALLELTGWAERGYDLAITPDGPRGPRYVLQDGVLSLAQLTGLPLLPVSYSLSWRIRIKSWDGFLVPLPFARWSIVVAAPLRVPREATDAERENLRKQFEATMREITCD